MATLVNYEHSNSPILHKVESGHSNTDVPELIFFNYHEFLEVPTTSSGCALSTAKLVINHFPNIYADSLSLSYKNTRILRIPRCYYSRKYSDLIPQFSEYFPGQEPGAIHDPHPQINELGLYDDNYFGRSSRIPILNGLLNENELKDIVITVNELLYQAFNPFSTITLFENILEIFTGGLFSQVSNLIGIKSFTKRRLDKLETFINDTNKSFETREIDLKIISPRYSGYLSVCII